MSKNKRKGGTNKSKSAAEGEYVVVAEGLNDEPIELPTNADDNTLEMSTLTHAFPGAHGLKFKNPKTGASRALRLNHAETKFFPPHGGWAEKLFTVIYHTEPTKNTMTNAPATPEEITMRVQPYIYADYFETRSKNCVVVISTIFAASFRHGTHEEIRLGQILTIFGQEEETDQVRVMCVYRSPFNDFIIYRRMKGKFAAPKIGKAVLGMSYMLFGFPFSDETVQCVQGTVSSVDFPEEGGRILGFGDSARGYSGGPAFSLPTGQLIAMNVEGPQLEMYLRDSIYTSLGSMFHASKEATYSLMIPIDAKQLPKRCIRLSYGVVNIAKTRSVFSNFLTIRCGIRHDEATNISTALIERGISLDDILEQVSTSVKEDVNWFCPTEFHQRAILTGIRALLAESAKREEAKSEPEKIESKPIESKMIESENPTTPDIIKPSSSTEMDIIPKTEDPENNDMD